MFWGGTQPLIGNNTVSALKPASISSQAEGVGIEVGNVTCHAGETVSVPLILFGASCQACEISVSVDDPLSILNISSYQTEKGEDGEYIAVFLNGAGGYSDGDTLGWINVSVPDSVEPGSYPVNISMGVLYDHNGELVENRIGIGGSITIEEAEHTEPTDPIDPIYYEKVDEDEDGTYDYIEISGCDQSVETVEIPTEIDGLPVTSIGSEAFGYCENLISIEIPNSITSIGDNAFFLCGSLTSIEIPNSVTSIENNAFIYCENLTSIEVSENNSNYSSIDGVLFNKDKTELIYFPKGSKITEYIIPESVTLIGNHAFYECKSLTSIEIPGNVTSIGDFAFNGCSNLTSIEIPDSVTKIGNNAFSGTPWLEAKQTENPLVIVNSFLIDGISCSGDIEIPDSVTLIADGAFWHSGLTSVTIPESVKSIGDNAFIFCFNLTDVKMSNGVTSIGKGAFESCQNLTNINIPNSVTSIGDYAFEICHSLTSIVIPDSVTSIGDSAFSACDNLTSITIENPKCEIFDSADVISGSKGENYTGVIRGYENSTAQAYAEKYNYKFESIGEDTPVSGDIDGDGKATLYDAIIVCKCIINAKDVTEEQKKNADVNGDGHIDLYDAIYVAECMIGKHK